MLGESTHCWKAVSTKPDELGRRCATLVGTPKVALTWLMVPLGPMIMLRTAESAKMVSKPSDR
jgi:hypothetical protein